MITEDYCSYEVSKLLKEKGFNAPCRSNYRSEYQTCKAPFYHNTPKDFNGKEYEGLVSEWFSAPTHQMACKWLREKDIYVCPKYCCFCGSKKKDVPYFLWEPRILRLSTGNIIYPQPLDMCKHYNSYEEAVEAACIYSLENLI